MCEEVHAFYLRLHYCTPGFVRTSAGSSPYKGATSLTPFEPYCYYYYYYYYVMLDPRYLK